MPKPSPAEQHSSLLFSYTDANKCIFESLISAIWGYIISELSVLFLSELPMNKVLPFLRKTAVSSLLTPKQGKLAIAKEENDGLFLRNSDEETEYFFTRHRKYLWAFAPCPHQGISPPQLFLSPSA